jgi:hypothetical protein
LRVPAHKTDYVKQGGKTPENRLSERSIRVRITQPGVSSFPSKKSTTTTPPARAERWWWWVLTTKTTKQYKVSPLADDQHSRQREAQHAGAKLGTVARSSGCWRESCTARFSRQRADQRARTLSFAPARILHSIRAGAKAGDLS